jgi:nucleoside triphosphate pyrophosphatase
VNPFVPPDRQRALVLASRSPRRIEIMRGLGFDFEIAPAPEHLEDGAIDADLERVPALLAERKCAHIVALRPDATVIAADTVVIIDDEILNKPRDDDEARAFLSRLAGRTHHVVTGVAVHRGATGGRLVERECTRVPFRNLDADGIARYVASGEGRDKAGSYAAQGLGAGLIRSFDGCFFNVVGLPVARLLDMLDRV